MTEKPCDPLMGFAAIERVVARFNEVGHELRSSAEDEIGGISLRMVLPDSSFPRTRESRFGLRRINLDTRFRGYDGSQRLLDPG